MYINNISVNTRHNRPTVSSKTALLAYFYNDGQYKDPEAISAVSIFRASNNFYPSSVIGSDGQIKNSASSLVLMNFANSSSDTTNSTFNASNYSVGASGIYRLREGVYAVVLDTNAVSAIFNLSGNNPIENTANLATDYIDVWTLVPTQGTDLTTVINQFTLDYDRFLTTTEPLLFRTATRLANRHIVLGSRVDLKFTNEVTIENSNIDSSITNLFKQSIVFNPKIEIFKENVERNLPARVEVSSFAQTSALCDVTSDNTVIFNWNTEELKSHPRLLDGTLGSLTGAYVVRLKFDILNQTFYSNSFSFIMS
jgi:hypothetical protein